MTTDRFRTLFVGIDISSKANQICFIDDQGDTVKQSTNVTNDQQGFNCMLDDIIDAANSINASQIKIGMEATSLFWWHIQQAFAETNFDASIYVINPGLVKGFKKSYPKLPKTDAIDAWVIADRVRFGRLKPFKKLDLRYQALLRLTRLRYQMKTDIASDKNRICQLLHLKFSNYTNTVSKSRVFAKGPMSLVQHFSPDEIANKPMEELLEFLMKNTNNRFSNPKIFLKELKAAANRAYRLHPDMKESVDVSLTMTYENIRFMERQCDKLIKIIERQLKAIPQTLTSIPGIGPVISSGILAEVGDVNKFNNEAALAKYAR